MPAEPSTHTVYFIVSERWKLSVNVLILSGDDVD